jgi:hypothetical protein
MTPMGAHAAEENLAWPHADAAKLSALGYRLVSERGPRVASDFPPAKLVWERPAHLP